VVHHLALFEFPWCTGRPVWCGPRPAHHRKTDLAANPRPIRAPGYSQPIRFRTADVFGPCNLCSRAATGTHRSSHKGRFSGRGCSAAICRKRIAIAINLLRLRAAGSMSPVRAHHKGGPPGPLETIGAAGQGTRSGQRRLFHLRDTTAPRRDQPSPPAAVVTLRDLTARLAPQSNLPTTMVRCVVDAMTRLLHRHRCCVLPAIASATMGPAAASPTAPSVSWTCHL
jgi:hypothetical protein